jgi:hypothetical protein
MIAFSSVELSQRELRRIVLKKFSLPKQPQAGDARTLREAFGEFDGVYYARV